MSQFDLFAPITHQFVKLRLQQYAESHETPIVDVVANDFNQQIVRQLDEEERYHFNRHKNFLRDHFFPGEATYRLNNPRRGHCTYHQRFCPAVITYEVSYHEDFRKVKYTAMCFESANIMKASPEDNPWWKRYVRKWQPPTSLLRKGEENMAHDDFCYWHYRREPNLNIQTREFTQDIVVSLEFRPMCDEAHEELAEKGYYVRVWNW